MITNDQISKSEFCVSCHQVAVNLGIKLEIVWDQYRDSPARKAGVTCQDCHMGKVPGMAEGMRPRLPPWWAARRSTRGASMPITASSGLAIPIAHPGIFPHNTKAQAFTHQGLAASSTGGPAGAPPKFEDKVADGKIKVDFPKRWADATRP